MIKLKYYLNEFIKMRIYFKRNLIDKLEFGGGGLDILLENLLIFNDIEWNWLIK